MICNTNGVIKTDYAFSTTKAADAASRDYIRETRWKKTWGVKAGTRWKSGKQRCKMSIDYHTP